MQHPLTPVGTLQAITNDCSLASSFVCRLFGEQIDAVREKTGPNAALSAFKRACSNGHDAEFDEWLLNGCALGCRIPAVHQYQQSRQCCRPHWAES